MSPLLGPILAQLVTLGVSDRTEVRHVIAQDSYSEVATMPRVGLNFGWRHTTLTLSYGPSITVSPLEAKDPYVYIFHSATLTMSQRWQRTTLSLTQSGSYGEVNLRAQALAGTGFNTGAPPPAAVPGGTTPPPPPGGTGGTMQPPPGSTGTNTLPSVAVDRPITFASSTTAVNLSQRLSARLSLSGGLSYFISGSLSDVPTEAYPTVKGPGAQLSASYRPTLDDTFTTTVFTQFANVSNGNRAWLLTANEVWAHRFSRRTMGTAGSGLSLTRNSQPNGYEFYSLYPNFLVGLNHTTWLGRSVLTVGGGASSAPFIDPFRGLVDPRVSTFVYAGFNKKKFFTSATAATGLQLVAGPGTGALNSVTGTLNVSYRLVDAVSVDSGVRTAWQGFTTQTTATTVPISFAMYAGITVALAVPLRGRH
jgi:hypothetical protein